MCLEETSLYTARPSTHPLCSSWYSAGASLHSARQSAYPIYLPFNLPDAPLISLPSFAILLRYSSPNISSLSLSFTHTSPLDVWHIWKSRTRFCSATYKKSRNYQWKCERFCGCEKLIRVDPPLITDIHKHANFNIFCQQTITWYVVILIHFRVTPK